MIGEGKGEAASACQEPSLRQGARHGRALFRVLKCQFGYRKVDYCGIAMNDAQVFVLLGSPISISPAFDLCPFDRKYGRKNRCTVKTLYQTLKTELAAASQCQPACYSEVT